MVLFKSQRGDVKKNDVKNALLNCGASECDILYIHTGMGFGMPAIKRGALLGELMDTINSLGVKTVIFPTFTFSFCNNEPFDPDKTPTSMGALNEFVRKSGQGRRSEDPLLSVYALGDDAGLIDNLSPYSIGEGSNYDRLHQATGQVKFLFFGTDMRECLTYTHYVEAKVGVPYRYNREFRGDIIKNGQRVSATVWLYSTYGNCVLSCKPTVHDTMEQKRMLAKARIGDNQICCMKEEDVFNVVKTLITENHCILTDGSFQESQKNTNYNPTGERVVSVL